MSAEEEALRGAEGCCGLVATPPNAVAACEAKGGPQTGAETTTFVTPMRMTENCVPLGRG